MNAREFTRALVILALVLAGAARSSAQGGRPLADLPLVEVQSSATHGLITVFLSADGGWASFDRTVSAQLARSGVPVVGWSSLGYYRQARTPEAAAADLARILRQYLPAWHADRVMLVGYSFGADVLPFLVNRLPADLRSRIAGITLIAFSQNAIFQFHPAEWLGVEVGPSYPTLPELRRLQGLPILCIYGRDDADAACNRMGISGARVLMLPIGHRMAPAAETVAGVVVAEARRLAPQVATP